MVAYLKAGPQVRTYSDYLRATREAEKEDLIKLSQGSRIQTGRWVHQNQGPLASFPWGNWRVISHSLKKPAIQLAQLEEEDADDGGDPKSDDPDRIEGVTEEFMVQLARVVKDTQMDEKHCYHCSSPEHFIHNCPLMKTTRDKKQSNRKEGMAMTKGARAPLTTVSAIKSPQKEVQEVWNHLCRLPSWIWTLFSDVMGWRM